MTAPSSLVVVGSLNLDLVAEVARLPREGETLLADGHSRALGGKGANQAVSAARHGGGVAMVGCVGADPEGRRLTDALADEGIDVSGVRVRDDVPTGAAHITVDPEGANTIVVIPGAKGMLSAADVRRELGRLPAPDVVLGQLEIPLDAVDTTGAGDAFCGSLAAGLAGGPRSSMRRATRCEWGRSARCVAGRSRRSRAPARSAPCSSREDHPFRTTRQRRGAPTVARMRAALCAVAAVTLAFALGACGGQSSQEKAQTTVCDARADIGKQVDSLKSLTPATVTKDSVTQSLDAIKNDLKDMSGAQSDLSSDRRSQIEAANKAFATAVDGIASQVVSSLSASDAKAALVTALQALGAAYQMAFAPLNCK